MEYKVNQDKLRGILSGKDAYADMVRVLVEQFLYISTPQLQVPIPGGHNLACISNYGIEFLVDAGVLVEKNKEQPVQTIEKD